MPTCSNQACSTVLRSSGQNAAGDSGTVVIVVIEMCADNMSWQVIVETKLRP